MYEGATLEDDNIAGVNSDFVTGAFSFHFVLKAFRHVKVALGRITRAVLHAMAARAKKNRTFPESRNYWMLQNSDLSYSCKTHEKQYHQDHDTIRTITFYF